MRKYARCTEETKKTLSRKNKGKHFSPDTEFKKGCIPWNKGLKGIRLSRKSEFKRGSRPHNWKSVGTITVRTEGKRNPNKTFRQARWIKIAEPNIWMPYSRYLVMKKRKREIPRGMVVFHDDNNSLNDNPQNLLLITRGLHIQFLKNANIINEEERKKEASIRLTKYWEERRQEKLL